MCGVSGHRLTSSATGEQPEEDGEVLGPGYDFLNPHTGDVYRGQARSHVRVALVCADDEAACLGDRKVDAGEARLRRHELLPQMGASRLGEVLRVGSTLGCPEFFVEQLADVFLLQVNRRKYDVARWLVAKLHDAFPEVGIRYLDAMRLEVRV